MNKNLFVATYVSLLLASCATKDKPANEAADAGVGTKCPDAGPRIEISMRVVSPSHLATGLSDNQLVKISIHHRIAKSISFNKAVASTTVSSLLDGKTIPGSWRMIGGKTGSYMAVFKPGASLFPGGYSVTIQADGDRLRASNPKVLFHVGPLPRVARIVFLNTKKTTSNTNTADVILPVFSEKVNLQSANIKAEVLIQNQWTMPVQNINSDGSIVFSNSLDLNKPYRIVIENVSSATGNVKLDGKYTGIGDSGGFEATLVPKDYVLSGKPWVPLVP